MTSFHSRACRVAEASETTLQPEGFHPSSYGTMREGREVALSTICEPGAGRHGDLSFCSRG